MIDPQLRARIVRLFTQEKWNVHSLCEQLHLHHSTVENILRQGGVDHPVAVPCEADLSRKS